MHAKEAGAPPASARSAVAAVVRGREPIEARAVAVQSLLKEPLVHCLLARLVMAEVDPAGEREELPPVGLVAGVDGRAEIHEGPDHVPIDHDEVPPVHAAPPRRDPGRQVGVRDGAEE